ncbi:MAG: alpha/beta hydrolase [Hyphomonadaceae bacterium]|nr:alpha/beta hydrolase [Hyphomonadaceae bacterium]
MKLRPALLPLAVLASYSASADPESRSGETAIVFESESGETVNAFEGSLTVPENRNAADSREITLKYVRFPATGDAPGAPIVYLSGGPGGSGIQTAKYQRFPLFMAMREFGDVIAFDQRGTGASNDLPNCTSSQHVSPTEPTSDADFFALERAAFAECLDFWKSENIDVQGYTTTQSVADLDALRRHLGAEKIDLWGISYGSHLSLAALQQMDERIGRVVITAVEGLDQTVKLPARGDAYFDRLQAAIDTAPAAKAKYPDVIALIARVLTQLETEPLLVDIPLRDGGTAPFLLQKRDLQKYTSALIADPARAVWILDVYRALDAGDTAPLIALLERAVDPTDTALSFRPMTVLMDVASGSSPERQEVIKRQARTALMGPHMNFSMHLETVDPSLDLGEAFRTAPSSDVPTLVITGTLDGRTYPDSGQEATAGLSNRQTVIVENGGHNVFMQSPEVTAVIQDFMRGEIVEGREIYVELPEF